MFCAIQLSLKDKIFNKGMEEQYRTQEVNRSTRRQNLRMALHPEIKKCMKQPVINYGVIRQGERKKKGIFNSIKKMFRLK
jgi:hypothetical protein